MKDYLTYLLSLVARKRPRSERRDLPLPANRPSAVEPPAGARAALLDKHDLYAAAVDKSGVFPRID